MSQEIYPVAEQADGNTRQDNCRGAKRQVVEQILGSKDLNTCSTVRGAGGGNGTDSMLLEGPRARVEDLEGSNRGRKLAISVLFSPSCLELVTPGKDICPRFAEEVGDKHDESSRNGDSRWFEL